MSKILTLLSTYNGEKYIREQLDSLLNQKGVDIKILIRDDGSKDNTLAVLKEYQNVTEKVEIIESDNCGSAQSFFELLMEAFKRSKIYDYYAFCDQDDVWLEDKLKIAVSVLDEVPTDKPALYMGAYQMVDANLNKIPTPQYDPILTLPAAMASNCATGCTMVFNKALLCTLVGYNSKDAIMHDYWTYLVCLLIGGFVYYDKTPHILYRQHGNNVIGGQKDSFLKRWSVRFIKIFRNGDCFKSNLANKLLQCKHIGMSEDDREFLKTVATYSKLSSKWKILSTKGFLSTSTDKNLQNIGLVLTGKF